MAAKFTIRQGDRRPWMYYEFGFDLTTALSVSFSLRDETTGVVFIDDQPAVIGNGTYDINGVPTVLTPASGVAIYPWALADTAVPRKSCMGLFKILWPGSLQETMPSEGYIPVTIGDNF